MEPVRRYAQRRSAAMKVHEKISSMPLVFVSFVWAALLICSPPVSATDAPSHSPQATTSQSGRMDISVQPKAAKIGDIVTVTLAFQLPQGAKLASKPVVNGLNGLTVVEQTLTSNKIQVKILVDQLDKLVSEPVSLSYVDKQNKQQLLSASPFSITVASNLGKTPSDAELRAIHGIIPTMPLWRRYFWWAAGFLGIAVLTAAIMYWRKMKKIQTIASELEVPAHIRAQKAIEQLESQRLFEDGKVKDFYFRFSEIMRQYIEAIRQFPAAELTTEEIASRVENELDRSLIPVLRRSDLVKFADVIPSQAQKDEEVQVALVYVKQTSPVFHSEERKK